MSGGYDIALWGLLIAASITDLRWGKIHNALTLPSIVFALAYRFYTSGPTELTVATTAVGVAFILFFPLYLIKAFAAGDVKLLMAIGAWSDTRLVVTLGMLAILIGAFVGGIVLLKRRGVKASGQSLFAHLRAKTSEGALRMPFAPAFLCGLFVVKIAEMRQWQWL